MYSDAITSVWYKRVLKTSQEARYFNAESMSQDQNNIRAFLIAFSNKEINQDEIVNKKILNYCEGPFVVIKQICVDSNYKHKGYGTQLYEFFINNVSQNIFTSVVMDPVNKASVEFHRKLGFTKAFSIIPEDNILRAVFMLRPQNAVKTA